MGALIKRRLFVIIPAVAVITMLAGGISIGDVKVSRDAARRATPPRVVGLTACAVPLRRALMIDPTEALRAEG